jgi:NAD(P)H-dependent flavin oxidoreductase YrpB (nitropropane dioxygenase family)
MRTAITEMFGIEFPILAFSHCRDVVAAVSRAGGLGVLGATAHTPDQLGIDLKWIEEEARGKPYGVDVLLPVKHASVTDVDPVTPAHRDFVNKLLAEHDLEPLPEHPEPGEAAEGRSGFGSLTDPEGFANQLLEVAFDFPIALVASALGPPPPSLLDAARTHDVRVAALAGKVQHAVRHAAAGVDIVVAQGYEAGGHTGEVASMVLVPEIVDAVAPIPVVAAGGIGRGRQMAAAMALGAEGVWCGSVWLTTEEAETDPVVKEKFLAATSSDTVRSRARTGKPARQLRSGWTDAWEQPGAPTPLPLPTQYRLSEPSLQRSNKAALAGNAKARQLATYFVGQIVGSMNHVKPASRVVLEMVEEFIDATQELDAKLNG